MRWLTFSICGIIVLTLQSTIAPRFSLFGAGPDWLLVVVVFFALNARLADAALAAWALGACADLMTIERPGLLAISYTLAALLVSSVREYSFREHAMTQFVIVLLMGFLVRSAWLIYRHLLYDPAGSVFLELLGYVFWGALYTAIWAPPAHKVLLSLARTFGLARPRYSYAGLHRMENGRV